MHLGRFLWGSAGSLSLCASLPLTEHHSPMPTSPLWVPGSCMQEPGVLFSDVSAKLAGLRLAGELFAHGAAAILRCSGTMECLERSSQHERCAAASWFGYGLRGTQWAFAMASPSYSQQLLAANRWVRFTRVLSRTHKLQHFWSQTLEIKWH